MKTFLIPQEKIELAKTHGAFEEFRAFLFESYSRYRNGNIPPLTEELRQTFDKTGEREPYEVPFFARRKALVSSALLSLLYPEREEYAEALASLLNDVCEERAWAPPAHTAGQENPETVVDLFAAELGGAIAEILRLPIRIPPAAAKRAEEEVKRRVISSFEHTSFWWERAATNWASVCAGNVGAAMMLLDPPAFERQKKRILSAMDCFLNGFSEDGVCLEGLAYWQYGFGNFLCFADLYADFSGEDIFSDGRAQRTAAYPSKLLMIGDTFPTVSDSSARTPTHTFRIHRAYADFLPRVYPGLHALPKRLTRLWEGNVSWNELFSSLRWIDPDMKGRAKRARSVFFPAAGQAIENREKYSLFVKAGHNDEPHNHNDVGSFILATKKGHALCDIGAGRYTGDYFKEETRYRYLCNSSRGHSVPIVNGEYQKAGKEFFGTIEKRDGKIRTEFSAAYGQKDFRRLSRTFSCGESGVRMTDEFSETAEEDIAASSEGAEITERFVSFLEPKIEDGKVRLGDVVISCSLPILPVCNTERHALQGLSLDKKTGNDGAVPVYLIDFPLPRSASRVTFTFTVD